MARILIVEDVRFIAKVLASYFEDRGHTVVLAENGQQALDTARANPPELILSDISMPSIDGLEVARQLKSDPATSISPILMLTARSDEAAMKAASDAGVDEYMLKPFDTNKLLQKATALLGGYPMNYALAVHGNVPVLSVLPREWTREAVGHLRPALVAVREVYDGPLVLDLARVEKVESGGIDDVLMVVRDTTLANGKLSVVAPERVLGAKVLKERLEPVTRWHPDLTAALAAHGAERDGAGRPVRLGAPSRTEARTASA